MRCATASRWRNCPTSRKCLPARRVNRASVACGSTTRRRFPRASECRRAVHAGSGLLGREERFGRLAYGLGRGAEAIQEVARVAAFDGQDPQQEVATAGAWMAALVG